MNLSAEESKKMMGLSRKIQEAHKDYNNEKDTKKRREIVKSFCTKFDKRDFAQLMKDLIRNGYDRNPLFASLVKLDFDDDCLYYSPFFWNTFKQYSIDPKARFVIAAERREYELEFTPFHWLFHSQGAVNHKTMAERKCYPCFAIKGRILRAKIANLLLNLFKDDKEMCIFSVGERICFFEPRDLMKVVELSGLAGNLEILKLEKSIESDLSGEIE